MKKFFTSISLAALTLVAANPAVAQQRIVTDQEKAAFVQAVVPAMIEQAKVISGIDMMSLANPNIENVLSSPLFGTAGMLRAAAPTDISVQPDSMILNLSEVDIPNIPAFAKPMLSNIKLTFTDYKEFSVLTVDGRAVKISMPKKISASALGGAISCGLNFTIGEKTGLLPFSSFSANLDLGTLGGLIGGFMPGIKGGTLFSMNEKGSNGVFNYNIVIGESLRSFLPASEMPIPDFLIKVDMTAVQTKALAKASLSGVIPNATLPMGDAAVYFNPQSLAAGSMATDSTILTSYEEGTATIDGYTKIVKSTNLVDKKTMQNITTTYEKKKISDAWVWEDKTMNTLNNNIDFTPDMVSSIIKGIISDLLSGKTTSFKMFTTDFASESDTQGIKVSSMDVAPSMAGLSAVVKINLKEIDDAGSALEESMSMTITMPMKDNKIVVDFTPAGYNNPVGKMYIKSNAMGIITDNETVANETEAIKIATTSNGLYVKNGQGKYQIVNMAGSVVASGQITSNEQYITTPNLYRGIYALSIERDGKATTLKFVK